MACPSDEAHCGCLFWHVFNASDDFAGLVAADTLLALEAQSLVVGWPDGGTLGGIECGNYRALGKNLMGTLDYWALSRTQGDYSVRGGAQLGAV